MRYNLIIDEESYYFDILDLKTIYRNNANFNQYNKYAPYNSRIDSEFIFKSTDLNFYDVVYNKFYKTRKKLNIIINQNNRNICCYNSYVKEITHSTSHISEYTFECDYYEILEKTLKQIRKEKLLKII